MAKLLIVLEKNEEDRIPLNILNVVTSDG
jgi:hypothetical protein